MYGFRCCDIGLHSSFAMSRHYHQATKAINETVLEPRHGHLLQLS